MTDQTNLPATRTQTSPAILSLEPPLSDKLSALLLSGDSPVVGLNTSTDLRNWLAAPRDEPELPTVERMENLIARLSLATKERATSASEARERLDLYWRALRDIPLIDLGRAFDQLLRTMTFMPTPAEVRKAALRFTSKRGFMLSRARHLVWLHDTKFIAEVPPEQAISQAEMDEIKAAMAAKFPTERDAA